MTRSLFRAALCLLLLLSPGNWLQHHMLQAQQFTQRLILKDGSYQSVVKYEIQGDRVHYLSAERYQWEDVPVALIDWDATKKYNNALDSGKLRVKLEETPEEKAAREKEEANSPEVAPGVRLPGSGGIFLLDEFQGKPELAEIIQNGSEVNKGLTKKSMLRVTIDPLASTEQSFQIKGEHAQIQSHVPRPTIYIDNHEGPQHGANPAERFRLVRAEVKKGLRVVGNVKISHRRKVTEQTNNISASITKLGTGDWIKLTPSQDLAPGEYAIVEMLTSEQANLYVWDFGVNPNAPVNPNTWQPASAK
jgi:hypothetical protein